MQDLDNWVCYFAYAGGFATGNFIGMYLEERLAIGHEMIRVITRKDATNLIDDLRTKGYGVTSVKAQGIEGEVAVIYIIARRSMIKAVLDEINLFNPVHSIRWNQSSTSTRRYSTGPKRSARATGFPIRCEGHRDSLFVRQSLANHNCVTLSHGGTHMECNHMIARTGGGECHGCVT